MIFDRLPMYALAQSLSSKQAAQEGIDRYWQTQYIAGNFLILMQ